MLKVRSEVVNGIYVTDEMVVKKNAVFHGTGGDQFCVSQSTDINEIEAESG